MHSSFHLYEYDQGFFSLVKWCSYSVGSQNVPNQSSSFQFGKHRKFCHGSSTLSKFSVQSPSCNKLVTFIFFRHNKLDRTLWTQRVFLLCLADKWLSSFWYLLRPCNSTLPVSSIRPELWEIKIPSYQSTIPPLKQLGGKGGAMWSYWMMIITGLMPPPACLPLLITVTSPDGQNAALPRSGLQQLDNRLCAPAWGKVNNGCLLLF